VRSLLLGAVLLLTLVGCARSPASLPAGDQEAYTTLRVFCDGFHSGLVLPRSAVPPELDPSRRAWGETRPGRSFHYGEQAWTSGEDMSRCHAARLAFIPGVGVIQSDVTPLAMPDIPGTEARSLRVWTFVISRRGCDALFERLRQEWLEPGAEPVLAGEGEPSHLIACRRKWSVWHNCHDFTVDILRAAGLEMPSHTIATAGVLIEDLDLAVRALDRRGILVIGPP
jgi:hypothetical protein